MSDINWNKIKAEYVRTDKSYRELSEKYSIPFKTLQQRGSLEKWRDQKKEFKGKLSEKIIEKSADVISDQITKLKEEERKDAKSIIKVLKQRLTDKDLSPQDVNALASAYEKIQRVLYKSFGIADKQEIDVKGLNISVSFE